MDCPLDVVSWFGAVQAQDYAAALWAVGQRTRAPSARALEDALADGSLVRTWPLRGTLHFVAARDARWVLALTGTRVVARAARRFAQLGLVAGVGARAREAFTRALAGGRRLTRAELRRGLEEAGVDASGQRGYQLLWRCAIEGVICPGPRRGKQPTFVLLDEWLPPASPMTREEALAELARRYFQAHGPATLPDFTWWSGLAAAEARRAAELAGQDIVASDDGLRSARTPADATAPRGARLLPAFDEYLVGYRDRAAVLDPAHARRVNAGGGILGPTVVLNARVAGTWKRTLARTRVSVQARLFRAPAPAQRRALEAAAAAYGRYLELPVELSLEVG